MIYNVNDLIAYLSKFFTLNPGDLILSGKYQHIFLLYLFHHIFSNFLIYIGTPDGIATFESGDLLEAKMTNSSSDVLGELKVKINYDIFDSKL